MREKLNENPLIQVALLGALALIVGFLLITRMGGSTGPEPVASTAPTDPATGAPLDTPGTTPGTTSGTTPSSTPSDTGTTPSGTGAGAATDALGFTAGPGLPKPVVDAYDADKVVVLLIVRKDSVDDEKVKTIAEGLRDRSDTELFVVDAKEISRYSRIAQGVDVQRTPALVVLRPKKLTDGALPTATIEYGFRGPDSVQQAVDDALYKGPDDLPYYP